MKKTFTIILLALINSAIAQKEMSHYTINLLIKEYPEDELKKQSPLIDRSYLSKQIMRSTFYQPVNVGIYGIYNGYLSRSNDFGLLSFSRKTQREQFNLVVTNNMKPTFMISNTIDQWQITHPEEAAMFQIKRHKDPETKLYYWKVLKMAIPPDHMIPLHSIIIIAKPKNIYVPLGATPTTKFPNLVLPPIYAKRGLDRIKNALFVVNIKAFFAPTNYISKPNKMSRAQILVA